MKCVNLNNNTVKILGVHFSYNKNFEQDNNFSEHIARTENILKLWRMGELNIERRMTILKSLAISKVVHVLLILNSIIIQLILCTKYRKTSFGKGKRQKLTIVLLQWL